MSSRIAAVDVGNDAIKTIFGRLEPKTIYTKCHCKRHEDRPVIGIEELDVKKPWKGYILESIHQHCKTIMQFIVSEI